MPIPTDIKPLILRQDLASGDRFVLYAKPDGAALELRFEGEEPWATRSQMADLFGRDVSRIGVHINKILDEAELEPESNVRKAHIANSDKPVDLYSLDMVLSVGYRVRSSKQAILFRRWANGILKQYLLKASSSTQGAWKIQVGGRTSSTNCWSRSARSAPRKSGCGRGCWNSLRFAATSTS